MSSIHDILMNASQIFTKLIIHNFIKKRSTNTYTGRCENMWLILKRNSKYQCHIWTSCRWRFAHFWFGARINHYQYHLIWEPGCHRTSFISNSQRSSQYHGLFSSKSNETFIKHQDLEFLNLIFWFLKAYGWRQLLNLKILNLILSKILKLFVEAFQNYFYKIWVSLSGIKEYIIVSPCNIYLYTRELPLFFQTISFYI
jgi:hypothetical protein